MARRHKVDNSLREMDLPRSCTDAELQVIDSIITEVDVPEGRVLIEEGTTGRELLMVVAGTADVVVEGKVIAQLGPGDHAGELALVADIPRTASVVATSPMTLRVIERSDFRATLQDTPDMAIALLDGLARRLAEVDHKLAALAGRNPVD